MWAELGPCPARPGSAFFFLTRAFTGKANCPSRKGPAKARRCVWTNSILYPQASSPLQPLASLLRGSLGPRASREEDKTPPNFALRPIALPRGPGTSPLPRDTSCSHGATRSCSPRNTAPCPQGRESLKISALRDSKSKQTKLREVEHFGAFSALITVLQQFPCELGHTLYQGGCLLCPTGIPSWSV